MLDKKYIRQNIEQVKVELAKRNHQYINQLDHLIKLDIQYREFLLEVEHLQSKRNQLSKSVKSPEQALQVKEQVSEINHQISQLSETKKQLEEQIEAIEHYLPNIPAVDIPIGATEEDNQIIHTKGKIKSQVIIKEHNEIAEEFQLYDQQYTSQICGTRFTSFTGQGAKLQRAILNFFLDQASLAGYTEISPPAIVQANALFGTGQLPKFAEDLYKIDNSDQYLIPTAEVPLTGLYASNNSWQEGDFPLRLCAYTPCFRQEAGSASRDTRGIIRQHQFDKVELVHICTPENSEQEHEKLTAHAENLLELLQLPYRRILLCTGDMGFSAQKCYDLEVWFPSQQKYREISSCSNCGDFQARRLNFRYRQSSESNAKLQFVHTLNGSGLAIGRTWAAILENYLINEKTIAIPEVLKPYMNGQEYILKP